MSVDTPLVSVIVPCYNAGRWVRHAVSSALRQTHPRVEVIVVDDGSTDDSMAVLAEFGDRIDVTSIPNGGACHARNVALGRAQGEFIQFLDADNVLMPTKIERSLERFRAEPGLDLVFTAVHYPDEYEFTDEPAFPEDELKRSVEGMHDWVYSLVLPGTGVPSLETSQPLYRRSTLDQFGTWDESLRCMEDIELSARHALAGAKSAPLEMVGVIYRNHPGERATQQMRFDNEQYFTSVLKMLDVARTHGRMDGPIEEFAVNFLVWIAARVCIAEHRYGKARTYLALAREIRPELPGPLPFRLLARAIGAFPALVGVQVALTLNRRVFRIPLESAENLEATTRMSDLLRPLRGGRR
ncbi:glycosyltransferase family 2 protein [Micromonospora sp. NPDC048898]|uniref:glycosyltransferase family 2 protein n=1 Tax=Micromonospora sp. NPDC048898 TaxID=3364260 RepID=UPI00371CC773